jgi:hypothetical protein
VSCGNEKGRPHLPQSGGGQNSEIVSRRRGRPPRQVRVAVSYRPRNPEEDKQFNDAVPMLIVSMVRERMATIKEVET